MSQEKPEEKKEEKKTDMITPGSVEKSWIEEAMQWLATPKDKRYPATVVDLCEKMGVQRSTFYWEIEKPEFQQRLLKRMLSGVKDSAPEVLDKLVQNAKEGETKAIELYMKYVLEIAEKVEHSGSLSGLFEVNISKVAPTDKPKEENKDASDKLGTDTQAK